MRKRERGRERKKYSRRKRERKSYTEGERDYRDRER